MNIKSIFAIVIVFGSLLMSCDSNLKQNKAEKNNIETKSEASEQTLTVYDERKSLHLNPMQKDHQLRNMRDHLEAVQQIISLLAKDEYTKASKVAYTKLGSTTEMQMMCASFGDKDFENRGLEFHKSADKMSEIFKSKNKQKSLNALSVTMNHCVQCHSIYKQ